MLSELTDSELGERAAQGDQEAVADFVARRMPLLTSVARRLARPPMSADDLLAGALANLLERWREGEGPRDNIEAYVIRSMRNKMIDESRSWRSRAVPLDLVPEPEVEPDPQVRAVELGTEFRLVREAVSRLPDDQQRVLLATVVDGRKPGDVAAELGQTRESVYALTRRARTGLQRSLLQGYLCDGADHRCRLNAQRLPQVVDEHMPERASSRTLSHIRDCAHCSSAWAAFWQVTGTLGISAVLVVAWTAAGPAPAAVAATGAVPPATPATVSVAPALARTARRLRVTQVVGAALIATGVLVPVVALATHHAQPAPTAASPVVTMAVTSVADSATTERLNVRFGVEADAWRIDSLALSLPAGSALQQAADGWTCSATAPSQYVCVTSLANPTGGDFELSGTATVTDRRYKVVLSGVSGTTGITGTATGALRS